MERRKLWHRCFAVDIANVFQSWCHLLHTQLSVNALSHVTLLGVEGRDETREAIEPPTGKEATEDAAPVTIACMLDDDGGGESNHAQFSPGNDNVAATVCIIHQTGMLGSIALETSLADPQALSTLQEVIDVWEAALVLAYGPALTPPLHGKRAPSAPGTTVWDLFTDRASQNPSEVCLISESGEQVTYASLEEAATRIAGILAVNDVPAGSPVCICMDRGMDMLACILACIRQGITWMLLDPDTTPTRAELLLQIACCSVALTTSDHEHPLPSHVDVVIASATLGGTGVTPRPPSPSLDVPLYICFTSGSSGVPKAVRGSHTATINRLLWMFRTFPFVSDEVMLQKTPISFVDSVWELLAGPLAGIPTVMVSKHTERDPLQLLRVVEEKSVTRVSVVPSLLDVWLSRPAVGSALSSVRLLVSSGEPLSTKTAERCMASLPGVDLINLYGSTELTGDVSFHRVTGSFADGHDVPIGVPIDETSMFVLDADMKLALAGEEGQLFVTGRGLSDGYIGTLDGKFSTITMPGSSGAVRAFATGDTVVMDCRGLLRYQGRSDSLVKVNGQRVSLLEVQNAILGHPGVTEAAVFTGTSDSGLPGKVLAIFVSPAGVPLTQVSDHLSSTLPKYMLPTMMLPVAALPRTATGKVDLLGSGALFQPSGAPAEPRNEMEKFILEVLAVQFELSPEEIDLDESLMRVGADSLQLAVLRGTLEDCGYMVSVGDLLANPTPRLLAALLGGRAAPGGGNARHAPLPMPTTRLSRAQEGMLFLEKLRPDTCMFAVDAAFTLHGSVDLPRLRSAVGDLIRRHTALRMLVATITADEHELRHLSPDDNRLVQEYDLRDHCRGLADDAKRDLVRQVLEARHTAVPIDAFDHCCEVVLAVSGDNEVTLLFHLHHLATDGWSMGILTRDLGTLFSGAELRTLPCAYGSFVAWQADLAADGAEWEKLAKFWDGQLVGVEEACTTFRPDHVAAFLRDDPHACAELSVDLDDDLSAALLTAGTASGASQFMILAASLGTLLHRYTDQCDLIFGIPAAMRGRAEFHPVVGMFVNLLPIRLDISPGDLVGSVLERTKNAILAAMEHSSYPFEDMVKSSCPSRASDKAPIFQLMLVQEEVDTSDQLQSAGIAATVNRLPLHTDRAKCDITFIIRRTSSGIRLVAEYAKALFRPATVQTMLEHWARLTAGLCHAPDMSVSDLPMLSDSELHFVTKQWNDKEVPYPATSSVADLFDEQCRKNPSASAIVYGDEALTFLDLQRRSSALARAITERDLPSGSVVAVCLPRGAPSIVAMLGIIRSGHAYVPLDPELPPGRLNHILATTGLRLAVVDTSTESLAAALDPSLMTIPVDQGECDVVSNPVLDTATAPAAVLFTSGSTGQPKGIILSHQGLVARFVGNPVVELDRTVDRMAQLNNLTFDVSLFEVFFSLLNGITLVTIEKATLLDATKLSLEVARHSVTTAMFPTSVFHSLARADATVFRGFKTVLFGGEKVNTSLVRCVMQAAPDTQLINVCGPTEVTFASVYYPIAEMPASDDIIPLGGAMANTTHYVVDQCLNPVPVGIPGELLVGGPGVALGYLGNAELSAERFIPDTLSGGAGARLCRTGDMARWLPDGTLDFVGRRDFQVKIRGFRVEPEEIQGVLETLDGVKEAIVLHTTTHGLLAYLLADGSYLPVVRSHLDQMLPDYMRPSFICCLSNFPMTIRGKIDRAALPMPSPSAEVTTTTFSATEQQVADIFAGLTGRAVTTPDATFFEVGGHSLLVIQLLSQIKDTFGRSPSVREVYENPSVMEVAKMLLASPLSEEASSKLRPLHLADEVPFPLTENQTQLWLAQALRPDRAHYNVPISLLVTGSMSIPRLESALSGVLKAHKILTATFGLSDGGDLVQRTHAPDKRPTVHFEVCEARHLTDTMDKVHLRQLDVQDGPPFQCTVVELSDRLDQFAILLTVHHLVCDGVSVRTIVKDLMALYAGEEIETPTLQYSDFVLAGSPGRTTASDQFWDGKLAGAKQLDFGVTSGPASIDPNHAGTIEFSLTGETLCRLQEKARGEGLTLFPVLLGAFFTSLSTVTCQEDVVISVVRSDRPPPLSPDSVGYFVQALPVRVQHTEGTSPSFLKEVLREYLDSEEHAAGVSSLLSQDSALAATVLQAVFVYQSQGTFDDVSRDEFCVRSLPYDLPVAKFPLTMEWMEGCEGKELTGCLTFNTDGCSRSTAKQVIRIYRDTLDSLSRAPWSGASAGSPPVASVAKPSFDWQCRHSIGEAIARSLALSPSKVAVTYESESLTRQELLEMVSRLSTVLRHELGVAVGDAVGVRMTRGLEWVVAVLSIWHIGAVYVPLDANMPQSRADLILADAGVKIVLTQDPVDCPDDSIRHYHVLFDALPRSSLTVDDTIDPGDPAYVIFTSGTTGRPKGVLVSHRALLSRVECAHFRDDDVVLQSNSLSFDPSVWELTGALLSGASLVIADRSALLDIGALAEFLRCHGVTSALVPTVYFHQVVSQHPLTFRSLRHLAVGGEALRAESVARIFCYGGAPEQLWNFYGPTETAVIASQFQVLPETAHSADKSIPIGRAYPNTTLHVLDEHGQQLASGGVGELLIGGPGLANGYINRPEATATAFVEKEPFGKLYRTGDTVRLLPTGDLEFLGRVDSQVKIRGYRIEPAEVEAVLAGMPGVTEAAVADHLLSHRNEKCLVGYVVSDSVQEADVRRFLLQHLPGYMVPEFIVSLASLPRTASESKVDRSALPSPQSAPYLQKPLIKAEAASTLTRVDVETAVHRLWTDHLGGELSRSEKFFEQGGTSLALVRLHQQLEKAFQVKVDVADLLNKSTIAGHADVIYRLIVPPVESNVDEDSTGPTKQSVGRDCKIAVVGLDCRVPRADSPLQLWERLADGEDCIMRGSVTEDLRTSASHLVSAMGVLHQPEWFDCHHFGMSPFAAAITDPQHRLLLECCSNALESAAISPSGFQATTGFGPIGIFAGVAGNTHMKVNGLSDSGHDPALAFEIERSNIADSAPSFVSFRLGLTGPSMAVQTACSSSAVSIHVAAASLRAGECSAALAGGVGLAFPQEETYQYQPGMISSPDGHCRPFDAQANGTVSGNGLGVVVLMRLDDALAGGHPVTAILRGSAVNNDGGEKASYSSSSSEQQAAVMLSALHAGGVDPCAVGFVEAHGTGTVIGDVIEASALAKVYGGRASEALLGSVKSNVGHLGPAAGVVSVIKAILALQHGLVPPTLHFSSLHPLLPVQGMFRVNKETEAWPEHEGPRLAAVNSFGQGGTNVHIILEAGPTRDLPPADSDSPCLLIVSGRSAAAAAENCQNLASCLVTSELPLASIAVTLQDGREHGTYRRAVVSSSKGDAAEALDAHLLPRGSDSTLSVVFYIPGQGSQFLGMGRELFSSYANYQTAFNECRALLSAHGGPDPLHLLFEIDDAELIAATVEAQIVLFVTSYSLARLLASVGVAPSVMLGHSLGEYVAACLGGVFSLENAIRLVLARGRLMASMPKGSMLAVRMSSTEAESLAESYDLDIAACNGPEQFVLSGPSESVVRLKHHCEEADVRATILKTSHAYHSRMMAPAAAAFRDVVANTLLSPPSVPIISSLTGKLLTSDECTNPDYWADHLRGCVQLSGAVESLKAFMAAAGSQFAILPLGPKRLTGSVFRLGSLSSVSVLPPVMLPSGCDKSLFLGALGLLWEAGLDLSFTPLRPTTQRHLVSLPTNAFQRVPCTVRDITCSLGGSAEFLQEVSHSWKSGQDEGEKYVTKTEFAGLHDELRSLRKLVEKMAGIPSPTTPEAPKLAVVDLVQPLAGVQQHPDLHVRVAQTAEPLQCFRVRGIQLTTAEERSDLPTSIGCLSSLFSLLIFEELIACGTVGRHDLVSRFLPGDILPGATLHHLATHTSGLPCLTDALAFDMSDEANSVRNVDLASLLEMVGATPLRFQPGTSCLYSVMGSSLLGHALAVASGLRSTTPEAAMANSVTEYGRLLLLYVTGPLGMSATSLGCPSAVEPGFFASGCPSPQWQCGAGMVTADGCYSTSTDMLAFAMAVARGSRPPLLAVRRYMLRGSGEQLWFSGLCPGSSCWLGLDPTNHLSVVVFSNTGLDVSVELTTLGERCLAALSGDSPTLAGASEYLTADVFRLWNEEPLPASFMDHLGRASRPAPSQLPSPTSSRQGSLRAVLRTASRLLGRSLGDDEQGVQFADLGLDSLQMITFAGKLQARLGQKVPIAAVFSHPTPASLALFLDGATSGSKKGPDSSVAALRPLGHSGRSPAASAGEFLVFEPVATQLPFLLSVPKDGGVPLRLEPSRSSPMTLPMLLASLSKHKEEIRGLVTRYGGIHFRGFGIGSSDALADLVEAFMSSSSCFLDYKDGISPRTELLASKVFTSTEYPKAYDMALHNEMSYSPHPPGFIFFACKQAPGAGQGGVTPIGDSAAILAAMDPVVAGELRRRKLRYTTNLPSAQGGHGLGLSWQATYQETDPALVSAFCKKLGIDHQWIDPLTEEVVGLADVPQQLRQGLTLRTTRVAPATRHHPVTGEEVWFNHAHLFHPSDLPPATHQAMREVMSEEMFPKNCCYADGGPIELEALEHIRAVLKQEERCIQWQTGDVMVLDNMRLCHGRHSFTGNREILVAMA